jgi:hypothetical protein
LDGPLKNIFFLWQSEIPDDHEDKSNIEPYRKNISQLFLSETVEAFVGKFGWNIHWVVLCKISGFKMIENWWHQNGVWIHTIFFALFFSFCGSEIQVSRQHMIWGPQFYSCLSNLIWILKIIETNEFCFTFLFFYS